MKKCKKCNVWPLEYIKRFSLDRKVVYLTMLTCTNCNSDTKGYAKKEKTVERWKELN